MPGTASWFMTMAFAGRAAKQDRKVNVSSLAQGAVIDTGNSCDTQTDGYLYIQNSCPTNVTVGIQVSLARALPGSLSPNPCLMACWTAQPVQTQIADCDGTLLQAVSIICEQMPGFIVELCQCCAAYDCSRGLSVDCFACFLGRR